MFKSSMEFSIGIQKKNNEKINSKKISVILDIQLYEKSAFVFCDAYRYVCMT